MADPYTTGSLRGDPPIEDRHVQDTIGALVRRSARRHPEKEAFRFRGESHSFAEVDELTNRFANGIRDLGVEQGDRVAVLAKNSFKFLVTWLGTAKSGAVHVPLHGELKAHEYDFFVEKASPRLLVVDEELLERVGDRIDEWDVPYVPFSYEPGESVDPAVVPEPAPAAGFHDLLEEADPGDPGVPIDRDDVVQMLFTSGTTSRPKGVMHSHSNFVSQYFTCVSEIPVRRDDRTLAVMPMFHVAQLHNITMPGLYVGASQVILREFDPETILETMEGEDITMVLLFASLYRQMADHDDFEAYDLSSFRRAVYALQMSGEELQERFDVPFVKLFGMTETASVTTVLDLENHPEKLGSIGYPAGNAEVALMDERGNLLDTGEVGEIVYRGGQVMDGYFREPERTEEAFEHGWFHSGDLGRFDEDGVLWFVDRKKDVIKTGGENVSSVEVEDTLRAHPDVAEAAVVGLPHERWDEAITAFVTPKTDDVSEAELLEHCKAELAGYKVPKSIVLVESYPESASGKIRKHQLREEYEDHYG
ncbi:AMP-binding protein [Natronomonas marina]|jgi:acyl-CoA synthetase (AMP-forming)/AMP-acid ligase II|uniref:AMP-binding protein n=1 Tax=Natronomonas marina TaxID=2961939 RepID=UPI0020C960F4|nr:AMP-binding protein [Natronomonas marina]